MEKELNENRTEAVHMKVDSTNTPENLEEKETPPSEEASENAEEPSPLEDRVTELEQQLEQAEANRVESQEQLATTQKSLAEAVSRYLAMLPESMP